jgi:hypothetical protein
MAVRHAQTVHRVAFKIEFNHHHGLVPDHPSVVTRFNRDDLWRLVFNDSTIRVLDMYFAASQEAGVRVHTEVGADDRLHVF